MSDPCNTDSHQPEGSPTPAAERELGSPPQCIGRYRVVKRLGKGGFGVVYLAEDEQLHRRVAVKVPHRELLRRPADAAAYLAEAQIVAALDHPNIVPVYDVNNTEDFPCFIVSKYIEGRTLAQRIAEARPTLTDAVELVATVAETLHYAHRQGLVHRDVKPSNILLDGAGKPYVADFGLALREQNVGHGPRYAGTPAYMSPEQARGEGHRVDGRSDICSLGVVFYELLSGRRPFQGESRSELLEQVAGREPRPLRQIDDTIPRELERICLKALSKRAADRYLTAQDMADDLRLFVLESRLQADPTAEPAKAGTPTPTPTAPISDSQPIKIVPKGLRSFDVHDADFFLELLPGPRDRDGLPDSIRFWKTRIEEMDADSTFAVGLIYGPSGCGKSSLVKAGLLPRLSEDVIAVYVEATAEETEARLLNGLRKRCANLPASLGLKESLAALRVGQATLPAPLVGDAASVAVGRWTLAASPTGGQAALPVPGFKKVLIILDQFEQWLHAQRDQDNTELVQALRQCDGGRVQCVVMVRDDFWMAATRFMRELEIRLVEGQNSAAVDLFPMRHAEKVLAAFGRAFGALPENAIGEPRGVSPRVEHDQQAFLEQALRGLAQEGKVICVRLALFAEMMKGKSWTPATLKAVGGTEGVGATFLEETFSAATAPPEHRYHQKAARAVLQALLPESGTDIKGHMRSHAELLAASGYASRPKEFDELLRILDGEIRLITPTDPEGKVGWVESSEPTKVGLVGSEDSTHPTPTSSLRYYQLTHDYLVPSLRDWLTRKQKETRRGRAQLLLADRAAVWHARPENRQLPSLWQWASIRCWTRRRDWTAPQQQMMRKATRWHLTRACLTAALVLLLSLAGYEAFGRLHARTLRDRLLEANTADVPAVVAEMGRYRRWLDPLLQEASTDAENDHDHRKQLHISVARLPVDTGQVDYLVSRLLEGDAQEVIVIRAALLPHRADVSERLWSILDDRQADMDRRFRAACAVAIYTPDDARWEKVSGNVAARLVVQNAFVLGQWAQALQPVGKALLPPLASLLDDEKRSGSERSAIANLYKIFGEGQADAFARLERILTENEGGAKRQANVGVALVVMGRGEKAWPLLKHSADPTLRSFMIDRLAAGGVDPKVLLTRFDQEREVSIKRAILLSLGEFGLDRLPLSERQNLVPQLMGLYRDDPDAGLHGAAEWLLRQWQSDGNLKEIDKERRTGKVAGQRQWYVNGLGQTMVVIADPADFWMGEGPERHRRKIGRSFAIAAKEVTVEQFLLFRQAHKYTEAWAPTRDCPVNNVTWYDAAAYCNWLSKQEGIAKEQWCYEPNAMGQYAEGMKVAPDVLARTGYRLPTEAEWEYACRAGADTVFAFGATEELVGKYAWHLGNAFGKSHRAGELRQTTWACSTCTATLGSGVRISTRSMRKALASW